MRWGTLLAKLAQESSVTVIDKLLSDYLTKTGRDLPKPRTKTPPKAKKMPKEESISTNSQ